MAAQIEREMGSKPIDALGFVSALKDSPGCYVDWQTDSLHRLYSVIDQFNDWGGGEDVTYLSPFWEETARKQPLPGTYLTNLLVKCDEFGASLPTM